MNILYTFMYAMHIHKNIYINIKTPKGEIHRYRPLELMEIIHKTLDEKEVTVFAFIEIEGVFGQYLS